jgi:dTDP-4-dehydrorhamnose reductase
VPSPARVLLFGGHGQLGSEIRRLWPAAHIASPTHAELDILDSGAVSGAIDADAPEVVVNCAAFHNVDRCEVEPRNAFAANALAVSAMAEACAQRSVPFVTVSTDYVFDGTLGRPYTEADPPAPISAYGVSKYAGELLVQRLQSPAYIVRTCGVYGTRVSSTKGYTFIDRIIKAARNGEALRVVRDQIVSPTYAAHLARGILRLFEADAPHGVYHIVNEGAVSWYDYACEALRVAGIEHPIEPVSSSEWHSKVRRPAFSALENAKLHALGITMPTWREGIAAYIAATAAER